jgi:hypothetical protein
MTKPNGSKYAPDTDEENDTKSDYGCAPIFETLFSVLPYFVVSFGFFALIWKFAQP